VDDLRSDGAVFVADLAAKKIVKPVKVGPRPLSIAFTPDGASAYVPSENGGTLTKIDVKRLAPVKTIDLGKACVLWDAHERRRQVPLCQHRPQQAGDGPRHVHRYRRRHCRGGRFARGASALPRPKTLYTANGPSTTCR